MAASGNGKELRNRRLWSAADTPFLLGSGSFAVTPLGLD
jgi:hypothetical protein